MTAEPSRKRKASDDDPLTSDKVSDIESIHESVTMDDCSELLSDHSNDEPEIDKDTEVIITNRQCSLSVEVILTRDYGAESPCPTLPDIFESLAGLASHWLTHTPKCGKIQEVFKNTLFPGNVKGIMPVKISDAMYQRLPFKARVVDQRLHGINTYFCRGMGPLLAGLDTLIQLEAVLSCPDTKTRTEGLNIICKV